MRSLLSAALCAVLAATMWAGAAQAQTMRDQVRIVGSSTVFPFSSFVAEELGKTTSFRTPVVESTGSGGGHKLFGAGVGTETPDITNSSRRIKKSELEACYAHGMTSVVEALIGFDGIAIAQNSRNPDFKVSLEQLFLAVAEKVPSKGKLVANPFTNWKEIDPTLPNRKILIYGPPATSGTRDAFEELVMHKAVKAFPEYEQALGKEAKEYSAIRQDQAYVPSGENDNLIVQKLVQDKNAFGIFGYSFLDENKDRLKGAIVNGVKPDPKTVSSGEYPISRSLYFYVKADHIGKVPGLKEYVDLFMSEKMIGSRGLLKRIGLIPLPKDVLEKSRKDVTSLKRLDPASVK
ncbi:PstS family phosphate ABC transporter substrate-binding protein [Megalodesulfovibrio gigas]|uniref:Putative phosphate-binding protein n=1 Tax=Megalodesulfovibrio gigas (strain ATCC 19364 / DSM 1382 / NCIMB 9332 / VKM B-1759) TaxID=1121448 RepID=T2GET8_MEGG1|nr:PstS family phosphate ABC transporter substrate-binding protein [Megalodesulfovibrio gigas]AGW14626.1 putative phosphate-binding protein [Megalodesulfovibrio gigas DSM 1382 = ATCC 19364]